MILAFAPRPRALAALLFTLAMLPGCPKKDDAAADSEKSTKSEGAKKESKGKDDEDDKKPKKKPKADDAAETKKAKGCQSDADCKGDRICEDGACVDPPAAKAKPAAKATEEPKPEPDEPAAPKKAGPRLLVQSEKDEVGKVLKNFDVEWKQTFRLDLNGFGDVYFASTIFKENNEAGYLVIQGAKVIYVMPKVEDLGVWTRDEVKGVWFGPIDADGHDDVIVVANYMTGVGSHAAVPFPVVSIFMSTGPKSFRFDEAKSKSANDKELDNLVAVKKHLGVK